MSADSRGLPRILCIMGSGETAPTMVSVHQSLLARLGTPPVPAVLLDTPFGFQENADDISRRAGEYFRRNVGAPIDVASFRDREAATQLEYETMVARVTAARYVFAGPGSPTYALRQWRGSVVPELLAAKLREGGCITFASAAACGLGAFSLPVYEVYKVGEAVRWLEGLDLLGAIGLHVAVIPHYDNAEGGTHDTRYCYMGERRLRLLEDMLPGGVDILGVDEHTACIVDVDAQTVTVRGRGGITWRRRGESRWFENGATLPLGELASSASQPRAECAGPAARTDDRPARAAATPFSEELARESERGAEALESRDVDGAVSAILAIDTQVREWAADTLDSDEQDRARATVRQMVVRLGDLARDGAADPRERLAPLVDRVLDLRSELRTGGQYALADRLRDLLVEAGIEVRDSREGSTWEVATTEPVTAG